MPRGKYTKKYKYKRKWRQQKLAVGTVQKIAREIAKKEDRKKIKYYINQIFYAKDGVDWSNVTSIVPSDDYRPIVMGTLESKVISDCGGLLKDSDIISEAYNQNVTIGVAAIESRLSFRNPNLSDVKITAALIFVPNLNYNTAQGVDFLRPDVHMLYKYGGGNLLFDGLAKGNIKNMSTSSQSVRKFRYLDRKTFTIRGIRASGAFIVSAGSPVLVRQTPYVFRKQITLRKYFKNEKKHNIKFNTNPDIMEQFTDGNYYLIIHSDIAAIYNSAGEAQATQITYCGATSMKIRVVGATQLLTT